VILFVFFLKCILFLNCAGSWRHVNTQESQFSVKENTKPQTSKHQGKNESHQTKFLDLTILENTLSTKVSPRITNKQERQRFNSLGKHRDFEVPIQSPEKRKSVKVK